MIRPFRAVMPAHTPGDDVTERVAPPYDVIGPEYREELLQRHPRNIVALELPEGPLDPAAEGNRYDTGRSIWEAWRSDGTLVTDEEALYVVEQRFELRGRDIRRRCLVAAVDLEPFDAGVILPHERTLPKALDDRLHMTRSTAANLSPVFAMFSDPDGKTDPFFEEAVSGEPVMRATDDDDVETVVWAVRDQEHSDALADILADTPIFIADGHHRYTTALAYRDECRARDVDEEWRPYDAVMMALVNMDDPNLVVLPAHRIADAPEGFDPEAFRTALSRSFDLTPLDGEPEAALRQMDRPSYVVRTPSDDTTIVAVLRADVDPSDSIATEHSERWKRLDVAVLQELILDPLLDIHPDRPETLDRLSFAKDAERTLIVGDHDVVFLLRPTRMDQLRSVALGGETMPQKSTYFYPKLLSGLLMRSLD